MQRLYLMETEAEWHFDEWIKDIDYHSIQEKQKQEFEESKEFLRLHL